MDHARLEMINRRNARTAKVMGNRDMVRNYTNLANFHKDCEVRRSNEEYQRVMLALHKQGKV